MVTKAKKDTVINPDTGILAEAVRGLLAVFEAGTINDLQRKAIQQVRIVMGDFVGSLCAHENHAYEEGDVLVCQDCRAILT